MLISAGSRYSSILVQIPSPWGLDLGTNPSLGVQLIPSLTGVLLQVCGPILIWSVAPSLLQHGSYLRVGLCHSVGVILVSGCSWFPSWFWSWSSQGTRKSMATGLVQI